MSLPGAYDYPSVSVRGVVYEFGREVGECGAARSGGDVDDFNPTLGRDCEGLAVGEPVQRAQITEVFGVGGDVAPIGTLGVHDADRGVGDIGNLGAVGGVARGVAGEV